MSSQPPHMLKLVNKERLIYVLIIDHGTNLLEFSVFDYRRVNIDEKYHISWHETIRHEEVEYLPT